jgi:hypothetical protein
VRRLPQHRGCHYGSSSFVPGWGVTTGQIKTREEVTGTGEETYAAFRIPSGSHTG